MECKARKKNRFFGKYGSETNELPFREAKYIKISAIEIRVSIPRVRALQTKLRSSGRDSIATRIPDTIVQRQINPW